MIVQTLFWKSYTNTMVRSPGTANPPSMPSGPWHENREQRIESVDSNPKLKGSKSNLKYDQYKIATTVGQARDQGASTKDLQFDHKRLPQVAINGGWCPRERAGLRCCRGREPQWRDARWWSWCRIRWEFPGWAWISGRQQVHMDVYVEVAY